MSGNDNMSSYYEDESRGMSINPDEEGPLMSVAPKEEYSKYYSEEEQMCVEPAAESNMSRWPEENTNTRCYNYSPSTSMQSSAGASYPAADNIYLMSYPEPGEPLMCGGGPNKSYFSFENTLPVSPHQILGLDIDYLYTNEPTIYLMGVAANEERNHEKLNVIPGGSGTIYWEVVNATNVEINGEPVPLRGSKVIEFDNALEGKFWPYEIVAWNETLEHSNSQVIDVYMMSSFNHEAELEIPIIKPIPLKKINFRYVEGEVKLDAKFKGKFTRYSGETGFTANWTKEVSKAFSEEIKFGDFKVTPKLEFKTPVDLKAMVTKNSKTPDDSDDKKNGDKKSGKKLIEVEGAIDVSFDLTVFGQPGTGKMTVSLTPLEVEANDEGWDMSVGSANISGEISVKLGEIDVLGQGKATGTVSAKINGELTPNWEYIYAEIAKTYGRGLASSKAGVVAVTAGAVVTSPAFILMAGLGCITLQAAKLFEALEIGRYAKVVVPGYTAAIRRGAADGLKGVKTESAAVKIESNDTAYRAGVYAGNVMRNKYVENNTPFDQLSQVEQEKKLQQFAYSAEMKMKRELWVAKASPLTDGSLFATDHDDFRMQYYYWTAIFSKCPAELGGEYLLLWKQHRIKSEYIAEHYDSYHGRW